MTTKAMRGALALGALILAACEPADAGGGAGVGGRFAFVRDGALVVSLDSGEDERTLTDPATSAEPALAPNGQTVVFAYSASRDDRSRGLATVTFAGEGLATLAAPPNGSSYSAPAVGPDGTTVVFTATDGISSRLWRVSLDGGSPTVVAPGESDLHAPAFLDASRLVVLRGTTLATADLASGAIVSLGVRSASRPAPSPDGTLVAYAAASSPSRIVVRRLSDGTETLLAATGNDDTNPVFSPDGLWVGFESKSPGGQQPLLYAARADGTGTPLLLQSGADLAWSF
jgi:TolB protein